MYARLFLNRCWLSLIGLIALGFLFWTSSGALAQTPVEPKSFTDIPQSHAHRIAILYFANAGILTGYSDENTFRPDQPLKRAEAVKFVLLAAGEPAPDAALFRSDFLDVPAESWFAPWVIRAKDMGIVAGLPDGRFAPGNNVTTVEFLKMLFAAHKVDVSDFFQNPEGAKPEWYTPYLNYAKNAGILEQEEKTSIAPDALVPRGQAVELAYRLALLLKASENAFLLEQAEQWMAAVEPYVTASKANLAKKASSLAVDLTQQALKNAPADAATLGAAKLARGFDELMNAFIAGLKKDFPLAGTKANLVIQKAHEAYWANPATEQIAKYLKDRAREILAQVGVAEVTPVDPG